MDRFARPLIAALAAVPVLLVAHWFDASVLADAERQGASNFDLGPFFYLTPVAHVLTATGVVGLVLVAWWSRSLVLGVAYAVAGGVLVALPALFEAFATGGSDSPTGAPGPIASTLSNWFIATGDGLTGAVFTVSAAMLLAGIAVIARVLRQRRLSVTAAPEAAVQLV